jgi:hypothetical protein
LLEPEEEEGRTGLGRWERRKEVHGGIGSRERKIEALGGRGFFFFLFSKILLFPFGFKT